MQPTVGLPEIDEFGQEGGVFVFYSITHDLQQHIRRLHVVVHDPVVTQETQANCDFVQKEDFGLEGDDFLVEGNVGIDRLLGTVLQ